MLLLVVVNRRKWLFRGFLAAFFQIGGVLNMYLTIISELFVYLVKAKEVQIILNGNLVSKVVTFLLFLTY